MELNNVLTMVILLILMQWSSVMYSPW